MKTKYFQGRTILEPKINELLTAGQPRDLLTIYLTLWNRQNAVPIHIEDVLETAYDLWRKFPLRKATSNIDKWEVEKDVEIPPWVPEEFHSLAHLGPKPFTPGGVHFLGLTIINDTAAIPAATKYKFTYGTHNGKKRFDTFLPPYRIFEIAISLGATGIGIGISVPENADIEMWDTNYFREIGQCEKNFDRVLKMVTEQDQCIMLSELYYLTGHPAFKKLLSNELLSFSPNW
jgi:hypothetical protein